MSRCACMAVVVWAAVQSSAAAQPVFVSDEIDVSSPDGAGGTDVRGTAVGTDGTDFLAVWIERDPGLPLEAWGSRPGASFVVAARIDEGGHVLDEAGVLVASALDPHAMAIAFGSEVYLVAWTESDRVRAARITTDGVVLDREPLEVASSAVAIPSVAVSSDGSDFFVFWDTSGRILGTRVSAEGVVSTAAPPFGATAGDPAGVSAAFDGSEHVIAWTDVRDDLEGDVYFTRMARDGTALDPDGVAVDVAPGTERAPRVACRAERCLMTWTASDGISGALVTGGAVGAHVVVPTSGAADDVTLAALEDAFVVAWHEPVDASDRLRLARIDSTGIVGGTSEVLVPLLRPALASTSSRALLVGNDGRNLRAYALESALRPLDPAPLSITIGASAQVFPRIASDGAGWMVVWLGIAAGSVGFHATRVSGDGMPLDSPALALGRVFSPQNLVADVAFGPGGYLVTWEDNEVVLASMVRRDGSASPASALVPDAMAPQHAPAVASNGRDFLVAWDRRDGSTRGDLTMVRVRDDGAVIDLDGVVATERDDALPTIASDGAGYLVAWTACSTACCIGGHGASGCVSDSQVQAARVTDGRIGSFIRLDAADGSAEAPVVAGGTSGYLVVWQDTDTTLAGMLVPSDPVEPPRAVAFPWSDARAPAVAFDGVTFVVTWRAQGDLLGARIDPSTAEVLDEPPFVVSAEPVAEGAADLAADATGRVLAVYHRYDPLSPFHAPRARARLIDPPGAPRPPPGDSGPPDPAERDGGVPGPTADRVPGGG